MFNFANWSKEFIALGKEQMSEQMSMLFINMLFKEEEKNFQAPELENEFLYQVIQKRAQYMGMNISVPSIIFLMFLTQSPGSAVMYLSALRAKTKDLNMHVIADTFPMGFVSKINMEKLWDAQKGHPNEEKVDNCLDHLTFN